MVQRINGGLALAALGGAVLIASLFLDWFAPGRNAWTVFELNDLILAGLGLLVLWVAAADLLTAPDSPRFVPAGSVLYAGIGALIIVVASLIQPPPGALHSAREAGAWLALAGSGLITAGGILTRMRISLVIMLRGTDRPASSAIPSQETLESDAIGSEETIESDAFEPEDYEPQEGEPEPYEAGAAVEAEDFEWEDYEAEADEEPRDQPEEAGADPDLQTRQLSDPPG